MNFPPKFFFVLVTLWIQKSNLDSRKIGVLGQILTDFFGRAYGCRGLLFCGKGFHYRSTYVTIYNVVFCVYVFAFSSCICICTSNMALEAIYFFLFLSLYIDIYLSHGLFFSDSVLFLFQLEESWFLDFKFLTYFAFWIFLFFASSRFLYVVCRRNGGLIL